MKTPEWLRPGLYGVALGAALAAGLGFSLGGWMTAGSAMTLANARAHDNVIAALTPVCLERSQADPARAAQLSTIRDLAQFRRRDAVMATGWATMPGADAPNRDLAQACLAGLDLDAQ